jgi:hypothetical protein
MNSFSCADGSSGGQVDGMVSVWAAPKRWQRLLPVVLDYQEISKVCPELPPGCNQVMLEGGIGLETHMIESSIYSAHDNKTAARRYG